MRWERYVRICGNLEFGTFWEPLTNDPLLVVVGGGFDPRVPRVVERLAEVAKGPLDVVRVGLSEEGTDSAMRSVADTNRAVVDKVLSAMGGTTYELPFPAVHARRSAGVAISRNFHEGGYLDRYKQVVVDVSGLPRSVFFPLVRGLLQANGSTWHGDLHVAVCESPIVDHAVLEEGAETPGPLGGFGGPPDSESWAATIWVPVLGEGNGEQVAALLDAIEPDEVVPVLPFPSENPRRADDIIIQHRELLGERLEVEPRNYLYAAESNPFDLYRAIGDLYMRYQSSLRPLGAAKFVLSTHSSKLLSIGVLLAALELGIQVMHVSPSRYGLRIGWNPEELRETGQLVDLWIAGEPYR